MTKPIRILHVLGSLNRGGAETIIMNIYRNIDRSKIQFDFIIHTNEKCDYDDEINKLGGKIYNIIRYTGKNHFTYQKAWHKFLHNHNDYKIIHGHIRSTASIYLKIAKKYGILTIAHSHSTASRGNKIERIVKDIVQLPIRYTANYLFACSNEAGKWLFGKNAIENDNYKVIKNAIDVEKYVFSKSIRDHVRISLDIQDKFIIGHVGSFTPPKNHQFILDIFCEVQKVNNNAVLLLVGDGYLKELTKSKAEELGILDSVIFTGMRTDIPDILQGTDVFLFPSLFEGLPVTLIEAQASGLICIVSDSITDEVKITDRIKFISLDKSPKYWSEQILQYANSYERNSTYNDICNAGYDVKENSKWLENFYLEEYAKLHYK